MADAETYNHTLPVAQLLPLGVPGTFEPEKWLNYQDLGLNAEHILELIRLATDEHLHRIDDDYPEAYAPYHAWRALGQLRAEAAIEPLLPLFELEDAGTEWVIEELPVVYGMIGLPALPALSAFIADSSHKEDSRSYAALAVEHVGKVSPEARSASIEILSKQLESFQKEEYTLNAALIEALAKLDAKEAAPLMERAFVANAVDTFMTGDWEGVQEEMGLFSPEQLEELHQRREADMLQREKAREKALAEFRSEGGLSSIKIVEQPFHQANPSDTYWSQTPQTSAAKKAKHKNKMAQQSRKKNRKR